MNMAYVYIDGLLVQCSHAALASKTDMFIIGITVSMCTVTRLPKLKLFAVEWHEEGFIALY